MRTEPFNQGLHECLAELGYEPTFHEVEVSEGTAYFGDSFDYCPAFDEYTGPDERVIVDHDGHVVHREDRDLALEAWIDAQQGGQA